MSRPGDGRGDRCGDGHGDGRGDGRPHGRRDGRRHGRGERGSALVEFCWVGLILFIPITWVVISVFEVQRGAFALNGAARAAARAYALAPDDATGAARAQAVVDQTLADQGGEGQVATVEVFCDPFPNDCHAGTSLITVRIESGVTLPFLPAVLGDAQRSFTLKASHTVPIGQFVAVPEATEAAE